MAAPQTMKVQFDRSELRAINDLTRAIEKSNTLKERELREARRPIINNFGRPCAHEHLKGGEETYKKVKKALASVSVPPGGMTEELVLNLIIAMQAQGILFREVSDGDEEAPSPEEQL